MRIISCLLGAVVFATGLTPAYAGSVPTIAVYNFDTRGLSPWWGSGFDPGAVLAEELSDRLVNQGTFSVVDREHLDQVLHEQNLSKEGDVTPDSEAQLGRMLGVKYLFVGKITSFEKDGGGAGGIASRLIPFAGAAVSTKTTLRASMKVIETNSGRIVSAVDEEQTSSGTSFNLAGVTGAAFDYKSADFQNSAIGKLFESAASDLAAKVDPSKLVASAPAPTVHGRILTSDEGSYVLNVGSDKGVSTGMIFTTLDVKRIVDPDSNKTIVSEIPKGSIQIISVSADSSIAKSISGTVRVGQAVRSE